MVLPLGTSDGTTLATQSGGGSTNSPIDAAGRMALRQAAAARAAQMQQYGEQTQAINTNYGDQLHDFNVQHPIDLRTLLSGYAGNGMAFSSGYGNAEGNLNQKYNTDLSRLAIAKSQGLGNITGEESAYGQQYATALQSIRQAAAERIAASKQLNGIGV